jgi:hypothetical protein
MDNTTMYMNSICRVRYAFECSDAELHYMYLSKKEER